MNRMLSIGLYFFIYFSYFNIYYYFKLEKENEIQRQLIEHMLSSRDRMSELPASMTTSSDRDNKSVLSSTSSSRSTSPSDMT